MSLWASDSGTGNVNGPTSATLNSAVRFKANGSIQESGVTIDDNDNVGIGNPTPNAPLEVVADSPGNVGGFASGALHVRGASTDINGNAVITGHNSFGGNKQLWYLGSTSSSDDDVGFINRQSGKVQFSTNNIARMTIEGAGAQAGNIGIGAAPDVSALLDVASTTKGFLPPRMTTAQRNAISSPAAGLIVYDSTTNQFMGRNDSAWVILG